MDNIWGANLADMQLLCRSNKGFCLSLLVFDVYCKHAWVIPLKDRKNEMVTKPFQ